MRRPKASLSRCDTCVLDNAFLFLCPFGKLIEFLELDGGNFTQADPERLLASDANNKSLQLQQVAQGRTAQQPPIQLQPTKTFSNTREGVLHTVRFHPEPAHDPLQRDEVLLDFRGHAPQVLGAGVALNCRRNPPGDSGARDTRCVVIPEVDSKQGRHPLVLPLNAQGKRGAQSERAFETSCEQAGRQLS